jgi:hypothetical protein
LHMYAHKRVHGVDAEVVDVGAYREGHGTRLRLEWGSP